MTRFQYVSGNIDRVKKEIKMGLVSTAVLSHYAIYSRYEYYRRLGNNVSNSVLYASESMCVSERCVFKVIKNMEEQV